MKEMQQKIREEGIVLSPEVLKVGSFLNQQIDIEFLDKVGAEIARLYENDGVTKILTIEASGIAIATAAAMHMRVPVVFAKKSRASNVSGETYSAGVTSFTHGNTYEATVSREWISKNDRILIIDDFLAHGAALRGLLTIVHASGAQLAGCAIAIEKGFQGGGDRLRGEGIRIESLAIVDKMSAEDGISFRD